MVPAKLTAETAAEKATEKATKEEVKAKKTIHDSGITPLTCTLSVAEALDSKAKAAAKCLTNMLVAAKQRNA